MHGLINRALEDFLKHRHGVALWRRVAQRAQLPFDSFEPLLLYDPAWTDGVIDAACFELGRARETVLEDMGTALVSQRGRDGLRRLLRFGGVNFREFLYSLEELPDRARLALPDLRLPDLRLVDHGGAHFSLLAAPPFAGAGYILLGLLRAMADDYGALVVLDLTGPIAGADEIMINLLDDSHAEGRPFDLTVGVI